MFLDGGTTAVQLARHLPRGLEATVVTHSPSIAVELVAHAGVAVELIGGRLFKHSVLAVGAAAVEAIARQPEAGGAIQQAMIITAAMIEGAALFAVVIGMLAVVATP